MKAWMKRALELLRASLESPRHELNDLDWKTAPNRNDPQILFSGADPNGAYLSSTPLGPNLRLGPQFGAKLRFVGGCVCGCGNVLLSLSLSKHRWASSEPSEDVPPWPVGLAEREISPLGEATCF